jgi:hypothetical protein
MGVNGQKNAVAGVAIERDQPLMLQVALRALQRDGAAPIVLPACNGELCVWVRQIADCMQRGDCERAVLFCADAGLACCVANKVPGIRAAAVTTIAQAERAVANLGANLLVAEPAGRTFFEFKQILRLCCMPATARCPPGVACVLQELDGHAHR